MEMRSFTTSPGQLQSQSLQAMHGMETRKHVPFKKDGDREAELFVMFDLQMYTTKYCYPKLSKPPKSM